MKSNALLHAMNDIDYEMVEEAENMMNRQKNRIPRGKKTVLIAAAVAVLLCITAAAAGLLWVKPEVRVDEWAQTLLLSGEYITLPEASVQTLLEARTPDRIGIFQSFDSTREWQEFFGIPFVTSTHFSIDGDIQSVVTAFESDNEVQLSTMMSHMNVDLIFDSTDGDSFGAILMAVAPLNAQAAEDGTFARTLTDEANAEILMESTTAAGVPYVISKMTAGSEAYPVALLLYYGYESVLYELEVHACSASEETMLIEKMVSIAESIQISTNIE